jgi:hypothetical protein
MKRLIPTLLASILILAFITLTAWRPWRREAPTPMGEYKLPPPLSFTVSEKNGFAAIEFGQWLLVFEGIPAEAENANRKGGFQIPDPGAKGFSSMLESSSRSLKIKQSCDSQANAISVNDYSFKLTDAGKKLAFADQVYEVMDTPKTIVIAKNGKTREQATK